jgi:general secretion pathway protein D
MKPARAAASACRAGHFFKVSDPIFSTTRRFVSTRSRPARLIFALLATTLPLAARPAPAAAQIKLYAPAVLTQVTLISEAPSESRFALTFAPRANPFAPIGNDPTAPAIGFGLSSRGSAIAPQGLKGLVRQISFDEHDKVLSLHFATSAPATISGKATGDRTVEVTVKSGNNPVITNPGEAAIGNAAVPPAYEPPPGEDGYELVMLKYADVSEIVGLLTDGITVKSNDLFIPREPAFGSNSLTGGANYNPGPSSQAPGSDNTPLGQAVDSGMAIDRRLNAIWLKGSPDRIARMKAMIATIDQPLDSVILETQFLELTESGAKAIGIDFANSNGQIAVATVQTGQFILGNIRQGPYDADRNPSPRLTSLGLQAAIYAQITKGNGRIVSKPRISAQSGSTAKIITGDALPILTAITLSGVNGVSQQVQYVNVGVTLQIAPRVSNDGFVSSHVFCVVSSVTGYSQGYPTISQREAETSATVRDGDSFVIGGLTQEDFINTKTKVPLLGDIPLLGQAFRTDRSTRAKTELYIVVTPHIVRRVATVPTSAGVTPITTTTTVIQTGPTN